MKKLSQINEGLWSKGVHRTKSGYERLEKKVHTNISNFKEVDLGFPFVFADINLEINGDEKMTWYDVENYKNQIIREGWRLITWDEVSKYLLENKFGEVNHDLIIDTKSDLNGTDIYIKSKTTNKILSLYIDNPYGQSYWCDWGKRDSERVDVNELKNARTLRVHDPKYAYEGVNIFSMENENKNEKIKVRLVKDKK